jgi:hypothetical protein
MAPTQRSSTRKQEAGSRKQNPKCRPPGSSEYKRFIVFPARGKIVQPHWVAARRTTHIIGSPVLSNPFQVFKRQRSPLSPTFLMARPNFPGMTLDPHKDRTRTARKEGEPQQSDSLLSPSRTSLSLRRYSTLRNASNRITSLPLERGHPHSCRFGTTVLVYTPGAYQHKLPLLPALPQM